MEEKIKKELYNLIKHIIPKLHAELKDAWKTGNFEVISEYLPTINACMDSLGVLKKGYSSLSEGDAVSMMKDIEEDETATNAMLKAEQSEKSSITEDDNSISDDEAAMLLAEMDAPAEEESSGDMDDDEAAMLLAELDAPAEEESSGEMNDDEAAMLLAEMDAPAEEESSGEMNDDEAAMLLAEMDAPAEKESSGEMNDNEAAMLLAEMEAPAEKESSGEMNDDEAAMLLAEMDAPAEKESSGEMNDDEAAKLLAEMDAPSSAPSQSSGSSSSFDEDAEALLASLGGDDDTPSEEVEVAANDESQDGGDEQVGEIEEFSGSEFASDPEMMNDFITNSDEIMENLDEQILALEADPSSKDVIEEIFRGAHTLKGAAGMFGFSAIERIMHRMENYFDLIRKGKMQADSDAVDLVLEAMDMLRTLVDAVKENSPSGIKTAPMVKKLNALCAGKYKKSAVKEQVVSNPEEAIADASQKAKKAAPKKDVSTIRVDLTRLDMLVNLIGELVIDRTRFMNIEEILRAHFSEFDLTSNMSETVQLFGRHMNQIQDIIMKVRMVPIGNAFNKFTRIVRDIARQLGKDIELNIFGEETELDKTLVEQIGDPLVHLIRNACDHGAETMEQRRAGNKKGPARIDLSARQEGNHIIISIEDDGKGMSPEVIRSKAIEKGLISEQDILSDKETFGLIFEPGFSTAAAVTNISGRGVGMDVVKKQIAKLKGVIEIDSAPGFGTTITIQLPLTLAIVQSLLVKASGDVLAIPLSTVIESIRINPDEIQTVGDTEVIKRRDEVLPLIHLNQALNLENKEEEFWYENSKVSESLQTTRRQEARKQGRLFVVVVGSGDKKFGIVVDHLLNQQEMVIKSMGPTMKDIPCIAGGAILGNGEVVLVLEVQEIERLIKTRNRAIQIAS